MSRKDTLQRLNNLVKSGSPQFSNFHITGEIIYHGLICGCFQLEEICCHLLHKIVWTFSHDHWFFLRLTSLDTLWAPLDHVLNLNRDTRPPYCFRGSQTTPIYALMALMQFCSVSACSAWGTMIHFPNRSPAYIVNSPHTPIAFHCGMLFIIILGLEHITWWQRCWLYGY